METREDILKELREIAPQLASLEKVNTYSLPDSYFASFTNMMLEQVKPVDVKQELGALAPSLLKLQKPVNAEVPAVYFSDFSSRILQQVRAGEVARELAAIAPKLSALAKVNTLEAPADYFSSFAERVLGDVTAQTQPQPAGPDKWIEGLNIFLDGIINAVFKPKYTLAFAGLATTVILAVLIFVKVQQCDDLDCRFAQLSTEDINNYLDNKSDAYSDEVFEMNLDNKGLNENVNSLHPYKEALKDVDDAALNEAITD
jgi:hypothetical protein